MNSAELSGVSEKGFGATKAPDARARTSIHATGPNAILPLIAIVFAAAVFIGYDATRSLTALEERLRVMAALTAGQIDLSENGAATGDIPPSPQLAPAMHYTVMADSGAVLFTTLPEHRGLPALSDPAEPHYLHASAPLPGRSGSVSVFLPVSAVMSNFLHRYGVFLAVLALSMTVLAWHNRRGASGARQRSGRAMSAPAIEAVPYGVAHWHEDGRLVCANAAFTRLLRLTPDLTAPGTPYGAISRTISGKISLRPVLDAERQRVIDIERGDGTVIMLDERPCPSGGFVTIVTDITDRKAADRLLGRIREEQRQLARRYHEEKIRAEASSRAKTSFLAHLSHDIRTPLNHIIGFADLIRLETFGPLGDAKYRAYVEDIKQAGEQLLSSFAEILEYAELEGGRKTLKCEPVPISDLLLGSTARFSARAQRAGVSLEVAEVAGGHLLADRHYLDRMLANLIDNAIRFTPRGGDIRLAAWAGQDGVVLEVTDTGRGMSEAQMAKLSQPFVLSDEAFTCGQTGIGLGIATARAIAEQTGGRLAIDSLEGIGTTVAISLPLAPAEDFTPIVEHAKAA